MARSIVDEVKPAGPVRVLRIVARLGISGVTQHVILLSVATDARYPTLLVTGSPGPREGDMSSTAVSKGLRLHHIPELGRRIRPFDDLVALWKLWRLCRALRPEIVHTHTAKAGALGRVAAWLAGVPVRVHTFHGHVLTGYFGPVLSRVFRLVERVLAGLTTRIVAISPRQARDLEHYIRLRPDRIRVIPLGLALDRFINSDREACRARFRARLGMTTELIIALVGRLAPIKNHGLALRAFARLTASHPEARLVVVGDGEEAPRLRQTALDLQVSDRVVFTGWSQDLEEVYCGSDIVALTSDNEGTPVCIIEALASGCAVVATGVGGVADVLEDGKLGLMVRAGDEVELAQALSRLAEPGERKRWSGLGRDSVMARYGVDRLAGDVENLYDELLRQAHLTSDTRRAGATAL